MRVELPESFVAVIADRVDKNPNDITKSVDSIVRAIQKLPEYEDMVESLVFTAIRKHAEDLRHQWNGRMRKQTDYYARKQGNPIVVGNSKSIQDSYRSVYKYYIAGKQLGDVIGSELEGIESSERSKAQGHLFNSRLASWLIAQGVTGEKRVRDIVKEGKLRTQFELMLQDTDGKALAMAGA